MKALTIALTMIALAIAPAMWVQKADTPQAPAQAQAGEQSLTGCLAGEERAFTLKTSSGVVQLEGDGLESHVGKTIRVTGTRSAAAGKSIFKVTNVEVVSPNCQA
jgi:hypothetical protein